MMNREGQGALLVQDGPPPLQAEASCTLVAERQRELIKTVAIDWSNISVRGSCLFLLELRRTGISSTKFVSLCQSCGFNRNARCPARLTIKSSTPVPILNVFPPISTTARAGVRKISTNQQRQVFRMNHTENNSAFLACNKNGSRHSGSKRRVYHHHQLCFSQLHEFVNLVFQTKVFQQTL